MFAQIQYLMKEQDIDEGDFYVNVRYINNSGEKVYDTLSWKILAKYVKYILDGSPLAYGSDDASSLNYQTDFSEHLKFLEIINPEDIEIIEVL